MPNKILKIVMNGFWIDVMWNWYPNSDYILCMKLILKQINFAKNSHPRDGIKYGVFRN